MHRKLGPKWTESLDSLLPDEDRFNPIAGLDYGLSEYSDLHPDLFKPASVPNSTKQHHMRRRKLRADEHRLAQRIVQVLGR
jgi:hypothetical protein